MSEALRMMTDGEEVFVARDAAHVREMQLEIHGADDLPELTDWKIVTGPDPFTICDEDDGAETKPIAAWIAERGAGYLCGQRD